MGVVAMKAYTEGPWEVRIWDGEDWPEKRISVGATDGGHSVCVSPRYRWNLEDFNLIAAAPDLFEVLNEAAEYFEMIETVTGIEHDILRSIRAAIKTSRGK